MTNAAHLAAERAAHGAEINDLVENRPLGRLKQ